MWVGAGGWVILEVWFPILYLQFVDGPLELFNSQLVTLASKMVQWQIKVKITWHFQNVYFLMKEQKLLQSKVNKKEGEFNMKTAL